MLRLYPNRNPWWEMFCCCGHFERHFFPCKNFLKLQFGAIHLSQSAALYTRIKKELFLNRFLRPDNGTIILRHDGCTHICGIITSCLKYMHKLDR